MTPALRWQDCPVNTYYTINRILLLCVGLWPYYTSTLRYIVILTTSGLLVIGVVIQLLTFVTTEYTIGILLRVLAYSIGWLGYAIKYNVLCLNIKGIRSLMEQMLKNWNELHNKQEIEIIKEYSNIGRFITLITSLIIYVLGGCIILMQFLSNFLLDITSSKNESHLRQFPILFECFIDQQKYFYPLLLLLSLAVMSGMTTMVATETLSLSHAYHACGLFEIASYRIEQAFLKDMVQGNASSTEKKSILYQRIISGFNMYKIAIEFIEMLKSNYALAYSLLIPFGVLSLSINLYRLSRLITSKDYNETFISIIFIVGHFMHMFFVNFIGQKVIDHSSDIFHKIYNVKWYLAPLKVQKLLMLIMQRSIRHCTMVMFTLFIPSFEGFATKIEIRIKIPRHE
ncbi:PREDICTED: uncharacterized protein LOC105558144 isoform X2 [Vollenhovia emeryi]|uniref:uncharacterized protein LOC105558144 isoform X2 n=1 Tax=Vollenhovia emeryi TaxID=411798 RepID=UPI0005F44200|nr:PREDICTED: uncharacterized protein LOC105558144 isoform X2 [Vollenhovia emeryi]